jgi:hypothetical protein
MIVPKKSATLGYPKEARHGLNGDHLSIAKYSSKDDPNFQTVTIELQKLVAKIVEEAETLRGASEAS